MKQVKVGGQTLELEVPRSLWQRQAIQMALGECSTMQTRAQVAAAALFLCAQGTKTSGPGAPTYRHDVVEYGAEVLEYLLGQGANLGDILSAGGDALMMVMDSIPRAADHAAALGNSEAPPSGG